MHLTEQFGETKDVSRQVGAPKASGPEPPYVFGPDLLSSLPAASELGIPEEMMEAAEEICAGSDVVGIETWRLEILVRLIVYLDREQTR
jgi:hypothetical protein